MAYYLSLLHTPLGVLLFIVHLAVLARAITRPNRVPASRVAWVAIITFLPLLGVISYLLLGETSIGRQRIKRLRDVETRMPLPASAGVEPGKITAQIKPLFDLAHSINGFKPVAGNRIVLLSDPSAPPTEPKANSNASIDVLISDIEQAQDTVHIGFYIWLDDHNGGRVTDAVCAAAQRGVKCRVMVDALGSRAFVHGPRWRQMQQAGVHVHAMLDDVPRLGHLAVGRVDLRNHRKVAVIDNRIAYCGSQNCADPEFRVKPKFAPWIDLLMRCEGPVVRQAQYLFLTAWISEIGEALEAMVDAAPEPQVFDDGVVAQMFGTGPTTPHNAMSDMFVAAMYAAHEELLITTPYFVPDEALLRALCAAPRRGVKTTIIFPARNDSMLVGNSCRSTWPDLLACGVTVLEYPLGLLHTKSMTVDGEIALVGSANMDRRSLELNYENNLLITDRAVTQMIRERQLGYASVSHPVDAREVQAWPYHRRLLQNAIGMMSPVL